MIENTTLKSVEEIILQNKKRNSRFISSMNFLFENIYNNYIKFYCNGDEYVFKECVKDIIETYSVPDRDFETENLFIIKQLIILALRFEIEDDEFIKRKFVLSHLVDIRITYNEWDNNERWPILSYTINKTYFADCYNKYVDAPIFIDGDNNIHIKQDYKNISNKPECVKTLNDANFGTYLKNFFDKLIGLENKVEKIVKNLSE